MYVNFDNKLNSWQAVYTLQYPHHRQRLHMIVCSQLPYCENIDHKVWPSILLKTGIGLPKEWYTTSHFLVVVGAFLALVVALAVCTGAPTLANELAEMEVCILLGLCSVPRRARIWGCGQRLVSSGRGTSPRFYPYLRISTVVLAPWRTSRHCWLCICSLPRKPVTCFRRLKNIAESFTETDRNRFNTWKWNVSKISSVLI